HGTDAVEDVLVTRLARHRVYNHVAVGKDAVHGICDLSYRLAGALEGNVTGQAYSEIGKIPVTGPADAHALDLDDPGNLQHRVDNPIPIAGRWGIKKGIDGLPRQPRADIHDDARNNQGRDGISLHQPGNSQATAQPNQAQTQGNDGAGEDVGAEVEGIRLERLAVVFVGDLLQLAR